MKKTALMLAFLLLLTLPASAMTMDELKQSSFYGKSPSDFLAEFMTQYGLDESSFSMAYYNTLTSELIAFNENKLMLAGSTYKLPLNMLYCDMLAAGTITEDAVLTATLTRTLEDGETLPDGAELVTDASAAPSEAPAESAAGETGGAAEATASPSAGPVKYKITKSGVLSDLMYKSLVDSDNDSAEVLLRNAYEGQGYDHYLDRIAKYGNYDFSQFDYETLYNNYFPAGYMIGCLKYLYEHAEGYSLIIDDLKKAMPGAYFKRYIDVEVAHKYGYFQTAYNDVGIIYTDTPFLLACYTDGCVGGETVTGKLAALMADYTDYSQAYYELTAQASAVPSESDPGTSASETLQAPESPVAVGGTAQIEVPAIASVTVVGPGQASAESAATPAATAESASAPPTTEPSPVQTDPEQTPGIDPTFVACGAVIVVALAAIVAVVAGSRKKSRRKRGRRGGKYAAKH